MSISSIVAFFRSTILCAVLVRVNHPANVAVAIFLNQPTERRQTSTRARLEADVKRWEDMLQTNAIQKARIREEIKKLLVR